MSDEIRIPPNLEIIAEGDPVWVTQGKTDHMATYVGKLRRSLESSNDSDSSDEEGRAADETGSVEVLIRWATSGQKGYVNASSVRPLITGERRRRQVVDHYEPVPSNKKTRTTAKGSNIRNKLRIRKKPDSTASISTIAKNKPPTSGARKGAKHRRFESEKKVSSNSSSREGVQVVFRNRKGKKRRDRLNTELRTLPQQSTNEGCNSVERDGMEITNQSKRGSKSSENLVPEKVFSADASHGIQISRSRMCDDDENSTASGESSSSLSSDSSSSLNPDNETQRKNHSMDNGILIVSSIEEICFSRSTATSEWHVANRKPTIPIQLYRLLRLSAIYPQQGLQQFIRWTKRGQRFRIMDETSFVSKVLKRVSKYTNMLAFRSMMKDYGFVCVRFGRNQIGGHFRVYEHQSIGVARMAKDPSLRLFYRGVPLKFLWQITSRLQIQHTSSLRNSEIPQIQFTHGVKEEGGEEKDSSSSPKQIRIRKRKRADSHDEESVPIRDLRVGKNWNCDASSMLSTKSSPTLHSKSSNSFNDEDNDDSDQSIVSASKVKLFHHSRSKWRTSCSASNKSAKEPSNCSKGLTARTRKNPTGVIQYALCLKNWGKIEALKKRGASLQGKSCSIDENI